MDGRSYFNTSATYPYVIEVRAVVCGRNVVCNGSLTVARAKKRIDRCAADAGISLARPRKYDGGGAVTKSAAQGGARCATIANVCWSVGVSVPRTPRDQPPLCE